jgi:hypothetical protein
MTVRVGGRRACGGTRRRARLASRSGGSSARQCRRACSSPRSCKADGATREQQEPRAVSNNDRTETRRKGPPCAPVSCLGCGKATSVLTNSHPHAVGPWAQRRPALPLPRWLLCLVRGAPRRPGHEAQDPIPHAWCLAPNPRRTGAPKAGQNEARTSSQAHLKDARVLGRPRRGEHAQPWPQLHHPVHDHGGAADGELALSLAGRKVHVAVGWLGRDSERLSGLGHGRLRRARAAGSWRCWGKGAGAGGKAGEAPCAPLALLPRASATAAMHGCCGEPLTLRAGSSSETHPKDTSLWRCGCCSSHCSSSRTSRLLRSSMSPASTSTSPAQRHRHTS